MTGAAASLTAGVLALLLHMLLVPLVLRLFRTLAPVLLHLASGLLVHLVQVIVMWWAGTAGSHEPLPYWHGTAVLGAGAIGYLFVFSAVYKSVSLRILDCLVTHGGDRARLRDIVTEVVAPETRSRMRLLVEMGLAAEEGGRYRTTGQGRKTAARLQTLRRVFGIRDSGLY